MRKELVASVVAGIAILSITLTQSYAMGGGGMGGDGGMGGGTTFSSPSSSSNSGMYGASQQNMTDADHAAIQNQHMGEAAAATMGSDGALMKSISKPPLIVPDGQSPQGNSGKSQAGNMVHQQ